MKHIVNYTSGLPGLGFRAVKVASDAGEQLSQINELEFVPSDSYLYSNHNVFYRIELIESISK